MNILVNPDIHGRNFWKQSSTDIDNYDKVIFLGDYLDPYQFDNITEEDSIDNFKEIIEFKKNNIDKVILLLGNHDMPYFSDDYYKLSRYHCRHSKKHHDDIHKLFDNNKKLFTLSYVINDIIFTHAGIDSEWLDYTLKCKSDDINIISEVINQLLNSKEGLRKLYLVSEARGGEGEFASCIWEDLSDISLDSTVAEENPNLVQPIHSMKQIFGHTLYGHWDENGNVVYSDHGAEWKTYKMLDCAKTFILDIENFTVKLY